MLFSKDGKSLTVELEDIKAYKNDSFPTLQNKGTELIENELSLLQNNRFNPGYKVVTKEENTNIMSLNNADDGIGYIEVGGNTLQNLLPLRTPTFVKDPINDSRVTVTNNNGYIKYVISETLTSWKYINWGNVVGLNLKPNTTYTFVFEKYNGAYQVKLMDGGGQTSSSNSAPVINGKAVITTFDNILSSNLIYIVSYSNVGTYECSNLMILEGDWTNKPIPLYFEGIQSVGEAENNQIEVVSVGKNLFDKNTDIINDWFVDGTGVYKTVIGTKSVIVRAEIGKQYSLSKNGGDRLIYGFFSDIPTLNTVALASGFSYKTTIAPQGTKYLVWYLANVGTPFPTDVQIEEGLTITSYEPYKEHRQPITLANPLRGLPNNVRDIAKGSVVNRNVGKVVLNGSESWTPSWVSDSTNSLAFYTTVIKHKPANSERIECISDTIPSYTHTTINKTDITGVCATIDGYLKIRILKSKLTTQDVAGFKAWLQANPVTVYYQLATPTIENLAEKLTLNTFKNGSIQVNTLIPPYIKAEYNNDLKIAFMGKYLLLEYTIPSLLDVQNFLGFLLQLNSNGFNVYYYKNNVFNFITQNLDTNFTQQNIEFNSYNGEDKIYIVLESNTDYLSLSGLKLNSNYNKELGIIQHMPRYYKASLVGNNICGIIDLENENISRLIAEYVNQFIVETATFTLDKYEEQYGLSVNPEGLTIENRRSRIKAKMRSTGIVNKAMIQNIVNSWTGGKIDIIEDFANYKVTIKFIDAIGTPPNIQDVYSALDEIKPAHLNFVYEFLYRRHEELTGKTHQELSTFTHETIRQGVI